jgi:hypothetical protein
MRRFKIQLLHFIVLCVIGGACIGFVGERLVAARRQQIAANRILDVLDSTAMRGKYNVFWYDGIVRVSDPAFGDAELRKLIDQLRAFPGSIDLDLRGSAVTTLGLSSLKQVRNLAIIRLYDDQVSDHDAGVLEQELAIEVVRARRDEG